ncbi:hypothetical protein ACO0QE_000782 [Hanseniaspora vineae]
MSSEQSSLKSGKSSSKANHKPSSSSSSNVMNSNNPSSMSNTTTATKKTSVSATSTRTRPGFPVMEVLSPGTVMTVGSHVVEVINYISEGGFAHIYMVKFLEYLSTAMEVNKTLQPGEVLCLKRVFCMDQNGLNELRMEVDTMKKLRNCSRIVKYYDSNATKLTYPPANTFNKPANDTETGPVFEFPNNLDVPVQEYFEVLVLMELCPNKSLLDYMNDRLKTKLSELEILTIMYDISNALYEMHCRPEPLIHKDIKIENVLVDKDNRFKLCDFGSTTPCYPIVTSHQEIALLSNDIYVHTTPQYRSPEMIDLYKCLPINEKSDIWALGVFLYKLLFFTTPFEMTGQFAILHSKYEIPMNRYSSGLNNLIIIMLSENPTLRPNIYQVLVEICSILKVEPPSDVFDYYNQGAYDFAKYAQYQTNLQNLQYQMFTMYQQKKTLNSELYLNVFEIGSKQPLNVGKEFPAAIPLAQELSNVSHEQPHAEPNTLHKTDEFQPQPPAAATMAEDVQTATEKFPSVEDLMTTGTFNKLAEREQNTPTAVVADGLFNKKVPGAQEEMKVTHTQTKQHKSNNPFPKMAQTPQNTALNTAPSETKPNVFFDQNFSNNQYFESSQGTNANIITKTQSLGNELSSDVFHLSSGISASSSSFANGPNPLNLQQPLQPQQSQTGVKIPSFSQHQSLTYYQPQTENFDANNFSAQKTAPIIDKSNPYYNSVSSADDKKQAQKLELTFDNMDLRDTTPDFEDDFDYEVAKKKSSKKHFRRSKESSSKRTSIDYNYRENRIHDPEYASQDYDQYKIKTKSRGIEKAGASSKVIDEEDETGLYDTNENENFKGKERGGFGSAGSDNNRYGTSQAKDQYGDEKDNGDKIAVLQESNSLSQAQNQFYSDKNETFQPIEDQPISTASTPIEPLLPRRPLTLRMSEVDFNDNQEIKPSKTEYTAEQRFFDVDNGLSKGLEKNSIKKTNAYNADYSALSLSSEKDNVETMTRSVSNTLTNPSTSAGVTDHKGADASNITLGQYDQVLIPRNRRQPPKDSFVANGDRTDGNRDAYMNDRITREGTKSRSLDMLRDPSFLETESLKSEDTADLPDLPPRDSRLAKSGGNYKNLKANSPSNETKNKKPSSSSSSKSGRSGTTKTASSFSNSASASSNVPYSLENTNISNSNMSEKEEPKRRSFHRLTRRSLDMDRVSRKNSNLNSSSDNNNTSTSIPTNSSRNASKRRSIFGKLSKGF